MEARPDRRATGGDKNVTMEGKNATSGLDVSGPEKSYRQSEDVSHKASDPGRSL